MRTVQCTIETYNHLLLKKVHTITKSAHCEILSWFNIKRHCYMSQLEEAITLCVLFSHSVPVYWVCLRVKYFLEDHYSILRQKILLLQNLL